MFSIYGLAGIGDATKIAEEWRPVLRCHSMQKSDLIKPNFDPKAVPTS